MPDWPRPEESAELARERRLVASFRERRDPAAFEALYELARRPVFAACLQLLREAGAAEDACHDVFVRAWERFEGLRGDRFLPWVRKMAVHHCLNLIRRQDVKRRVLASVPVEPPSPGSERQAIARQELERARDVLDRLSEPQREVLLLRHLDGLGRSEIAELTGLTTEQVRSHLQNARRNFAIAWDRLTGRERGHG